VAYRRISAADALPALADRRGIASLEYAVLAALIAIATAAGAAGLGGAVNGALGGMAAAAQGPSMSASDRGPN
jgi:Flp pilus assembly pilin Flp